MHFGGYGDGLQVRQQLYRTFLHPKLAETEWQETVLLHQMAPNSPQLTLSLSLSGFMDSPPTFDPIDRTIPTQPQLASWQQLSDEPPPRQSHIQDSSIVRVPSSFLQSAQQQPRRPESPQPSVNLFPREPESITASRATVLALPPARGMPATTTTGALEVFHNPKLERSPGNHRTHNADNLPFLQDILSSKSHSRFYERKLPPPLHSSPVPPLGVRAREPGKTRQGLPITLHTLGGLATVLACPDTGADVNIISDELARTAGYAPYGLLPEKTEFALANGKIVEAIGQIESTCSFGVEMDSSVSFTCMFYVLLKAATPIIMGLSFLEKTKTMTEHRERLVRVPRPAFQPLSVYSLDRPRKVLECEVDRIGTLAVADSGSDVDIMSLVYASERGFEIHQEETEVEMADGSLAIASAFVRANLSVLPDAKLDLPVPSTDEITVKFYILEGFLHDVLVCEDTLVELQAYSVNQHALVTAPTSHGPLGLNTIRLRGKIEKLVIRLLGKEEAQSSASGMY
jgi:hypothetical protein